MRSDKVRLGVVGVGTWGNVHVRAYSQHPSAQLVAVCDLNEDAARQTAEQYGVEKFYTDVDEMLDKEQLDGVSIATPDNAHTDVALKVARKGIHLLVEKPLATSVDECEQMIEAAASNDVYLMVDWHNRWNPIYYKAWESIRNGEIGDVLYIYTRLSDTIYVPTKMLPWAGKSSVLHFLGSHSIDTICWLLDDEPVTVFCKRKEVVLEGMGITTPDLYITILDFAKGATAVVENCWILPQSSPSLIDHKCEIIGTAGVINIDSTHHRAFAKYTDATPQGYPHTSFSDMFVTPEIHGQQKGFAVESIYHFVDCIRDGQKPLTSGEDGLLNTRLLLAAEKSARSGKPEELKIKN